jgi:VIT1/CCC1 family predicted Fe2+/Mn2+ transporter
MSGDLARSHRPEPSPDLPAEVARTKARLPILRGLARSIRGRRPSGPILPHPGPIEGEPRTGGKSGALRAAIFGANDGLVSNVALIMGFAGAQVDNRVVLLAGIAGLLAGAFSMGAGEYVSMRVQRELFERLIHLEAHELAATPDEERRELAELFEAKGVPPRLADEVAEALMADPKVALETHAREELGLDPNEGLGSPWGAAGSSFLTFSLGASVPLAPFLLTEGAAAIAASAVLTGVTLFAVGAAMTLFTGKRVHRSGLRMLAIGSGAAAITFTVGSLLGVHVVG